MNEIFILVIAAIVGLFLGIIFFGGLWWTIRKAVHSKNPAALFLISFFTRIAIVLIGFYFLLGGHWERLLLGLLGFIMARLLVTKFLELPSNGVTNAA